MNNGWFISAKEYGVKAATLGTQWPLSLRSTSLAYFM